MTTLPPNRTPVRLSDDSLPAPEVVWIVGGEHFAPPSPVGNRTRLPVDVDEIIARKNPDSPTYTYSPAKRLEWMPEVDSRYVTVSNGKTDPYQIPRGSSLKETIPKDDWGLGTRQRCQDLFGRKWKAGKKTGYDFVLCRTCDHCRGWDLILDQARIEHAIEHPAVTYIDEDRWRAFCQKRKRQGLTPIYSVPIVVGRSKKRQRAVIIDAEGLEMPHTIVEDLAQTLTDLESRRDRQGDTRHSSSSGMLSREAVEQMVYPKASTPVPAEEKKETTGYFNPRKLTGSHLSDAVEIDAAIAGLVEKATMAGARFRTAGMGIILEVDDPAAEGRLDELLGVVPAVVKAAA